MGLDFNASINKVPQTGQFFTSESGRCWGQFFKAMTGGPFLKLNQAEMTRGRKAVFLKLNHTKAIYVWDCFFKAESRPNQAEAS